MADFKIFCNNTGSVSEEEIREHDISVLKLGVIIEDKLYKDIPTEEFYAQLRAGAMPKTNAANLGEVLDAFEPVLQAGQDILSIPLSSGLSATYGAMVQAAAELGEKYPERKIYIIDSLVAASGERILVLEAARMKREGKSIDEIRDWLEQNKLNVAHWFVVDDLAHLKRGGRISPAKAFFGAKLNVKPILRMDNDGKLEATGKTRGRPAAMDFLLKKFGETVVNPEENIAYIANTDCADAEPLKAKLIEQFKVKDVVIHPLNPVIASHTGMGLIALIYMGNGRD